MQMEPFVDRVRQARRFLLATHQAPDGDGIGTALGLASVLGCLGMQAEVCIEGAVPPRLAFLPGAERLRDWNRREILAGSDLALVVDTQNWDLVGAVGAALRDVALPVLFLDHHPPRGPAREEVLCDAEASSTGEIAWRLVRALAPPRIPPEAATCLYAAIAYDTNSFKYLRGRSSAHRAFR